MGSSAFVDAVRRANADEFDWPRAPRDSLVPAGQKVRQRGRRPHLTIVSILERWRDNDRPRPCRASIDQMAQDDPAGLGAWMLSQTLSDALLAYAAETLGRETVDFTGDGVVSLLPRLLQHPSPLVREGTVYGMSYHPEILRRYRPVLAAQLEFDDSPGVREAISEVLEEG